MTEGDLDGATAHDGPVDMMGYPVAPVLFDFTPAMLAAARALAKAHGYEWDVVLKDPSVCGKRFIGDVRIVAQHLKDTTP